MEEVEFIAGNGQMQPMFEITKPMEHTQLVTRNNSVVAVKTLRLIAERIVKKNQLVLEAIKNMECSEEFKVSNFRQVN